MGGTSRVVDVVGEGLLSFLFIPVDLMRDELLKHNITHSGDSRVGVMDGFSGIAVSREASSA